MDNEFNQMVADLKKPGQDILDTLDATRCSLLHVGSALVGEVIEFTLADSEENVIEEAGDIEFYFQALLQDLGLDTVDLQSILPDSTVYVAPDLEVLASAEKVGDLIKKYTMYNKTILLQEFAAALASLRLALNSSYMVLGISQDQAMKHNLNKLLKGDNARYKSGNYSDQQAQTRADKA